MMQLLQGFPREFELVPHFVRRLSHRSAHQWRVLAARLQRNQLVEHDLVFD